VVDLRLDGAIIAGLEPASGPADLGADDALLAPVFCDLQVKRLWRPRLQLRLLEQADRPARDGRRDRTGRGGQRHRPALSDRW